MDRGVGGRPAAAGSVDEGERNVVGVVGLLRDAAVPLDRMCREARLSAPVGEIALGEASHSVHRALLVLDEPDRVHPGEVDRLVAGAGRLR